MENLEDLKREYQRTSVPQFKMPSSSVPIKPVGTEGVPVEVAPISQPAIQFPTAEEIIAKSDVSHIDLDKYKLGPGDQLNIIFYGRISATFPVSVQPDGTVFLAPAKPIYLQGLTISQAQRKVYNLMENYYKNFKVSLQILKLRTFKVEVLGEVKVPGTYIITPTVGVCDAIGLAGGLKDEASLRNVELRDLKKNKCRRIDLFAWYFLGQENENLLLEQEQVIFVPLKKEKITVEGAFKRKGTFEIVPGERISDILRMIEPATGAVLNEAKVTRISSGENLSVFPLNLKKVLEDSKTEENLVLADGDIIFIPDISVFLKKVTVIGEFQGANFFTKTINRLTGQEEILKVGLYNLREGERVKDIIIHLGGFTVQADLEKGRIERPVGGGRIKVIPVDLRKLLYEDDASQNYALIAGDIVVVPAKVSSIFILGEIRSPGAYPYNVGNRLKDYIALAGGPTFRARMKMTKVIQDVDGKLMVRTIDLRSILTGNKVEEFELRPGDVIYIPYADVANWKDIVGIITDLIVLRQLFR